MIPSKSRLPWGFEDNSSCLAAHRVIALSPFDTNMVYFDIHRITDPTVIIIIIIIIIIITLFNEGNI